MTEAVTLPELPTKPAGSWMLNDWARAFATQAVLAERERAARVCDDIAKRHDAAAKENCAAFHSDEGEADASVAASECAAAIRKG